jgi:hypothetical protein
MSNQTGPAGGRHPRWWSNHLSTEYQQFIEHEAEASRISVYQALIVPGLLQTVEYARAVSASITRTDPDGEGVAARVETRLGRQDAFLRRANNAQPPSLFAALDEAVLRRPVGGTDVMRRQLDHLLVIAQMPMTELVVVPMGLDGHPGLGGTFDLLEFPNHGYPNLVFVESATTDFMITDPATTQTYRDNVAILRARGHAGTDAIRDIEAVRSSLDM